MIRLKRVLFAAPGALVLCVGLSPIWPARAQDDGGPVKRARIVIRTPDGEQVYDVDPSELPDIGIGKNVVIMRRGPNGEISTFVGSPDMGGQGGLAYSLPGAAGPNGGPNFGISVIDPGTDYVYALLKRVDVAEEIHLNARQREALEAAETIQQQARQEQMKQGIEELTSGINSKSPADLQAAVAEHAKKMADAMKRSTDSRLKTLVSILRPEQLARLKELDLQFRGPLAMGVGEVAQEATLDRDHAAKITSMLTEYRQEVRKNLAFGTRTISLKGGSSAPPANTPPPDSEEMRVKLVKADKAIRKSRETLGAAALASLADPQRAQWSKLTGKPFEFHPAL